MPFDFLGSVSKEVNSAVNKALNTAQNYVSTAVNKTARDFISKGSEKLLNDIGAPQIVREMVRNVNAEIVQNAVNSAGNIFRGLVNGTIASTELSKFTSLDVVKNALKINQTARDVANLNILAQVARDVTKERPPEIEIEHQASPYATDIANYFNPKFGFLFVVEFIFNSPFNQHDVFGRNDIHILINKFERPKVEIEHEEVNLYNFITQVPKKVRYSPVSFTAHDDGKSNTLSALIGYLRTISPIFKVDAEDGMDYEYLGGMTFSEDNNSSNFSTIQQGLYGSNIEEIGIAEENLKSIIKEIKVYHVYNFGQYVDVYKFFNPKITNISLDELDMNDNKINSVTVEFVYDGLYIDYQKNPGDIINFSDLNFSALYNMVNRNVQHASLVRSEQQRSFEQQQKKIARQKADEQIVEYEAMLQRAAIDQNLDISNDAAVEQFLLDKAYREGLQRLEQVASISTDNIIGNITKSFKNIF